MKSQGDNLQMEQSNSYCFIILLNLEYEFRGNMEMKETWTLPEVLNESKELWVPPIDFFKGL